MSVIASKKEIKPNLKQQECIDNINGFYMVLAGPGTGKTFTLTRRIKEMIEKHNIKPEEILCLTYSETAANEMKTKLINLLGNIAVNLHISTYHSFCNEIIQNYPDKFNLQENVKLIDAISKDLLAKKCLDDAYNNKIDLTVITEQKTGNYYNCQNDLLHVVSDMKKYRLTNEQILNNIEKNPDWQPKLDELIIKRDEKLAKATPDKPARIKTLLNDIESLEKKITKAKLLVNLAEDYKNLMTKYNYIDFDDMVTSVIDVTEEDTELGKDAFSNFKYILVDEYQDTNTVQNILIDRIIQHVDNANVFVVGDDDQIIYGFQGASLNNCENFLRKYPKTKVICLTENNRSTQTILDFGNQVITQDLKRLENNPEFQQYNISKKLTAKNEKITQLDTKIKYTVFNEKIIENNSLVEQIKTLISNLKPDEKLSDIAILAKKNSQIEEIATLLENANIPYQKKLGKSIFDVPSSLLLYSYLKLLNNPKTSVDKQFSILMQEPFKIDEEDYEFILSQNRPLWKDFISIIEENKEHNWKNPDKINNFIETYKKLQDLKYKKSLRTFVLHVANETGILAYYANSKIDVEENILAIKRLIVEAAAYKEIFLNNFLDEEITPGPYLSNFLNYLDKCYKSNASPELEKNTETINAVQLLTYHGSKGREFNHVFMPWLSSRFFEKSKDPYEFSVPHSSKSLSKEEKEELKISELLKLIFVGITRAKFDLRLSFSLYEENSPKQLTSLLNEIITNNPLIEMEIPKEQNILEEKIKSITAPFYDKYQNDIQERIKNLQLSAYSFNLYRNCPRAYLYSEIYKIPTEKENSNAMDFGNAIHKSMQLLIQNAQKTGEYLPKETIIKNSLNYLKTCEFEDEKTYEAYQKRATETLDKYYHHITDIPVKNIFASEYKFENIELGTMSLKGFIDLVIKNNDGTYSLFDFKTGNAKSKSSINIGKDYEHYWYQLAFYHIAFEMLNEDYSVQETGLKFVEEEGKDVYIQLTQDEINNVKEEIKDVTENITSLNFKMKHKQDNSKTCKYCNYKLLCKMQPEK